MYYIPDSSSYSHLCVWGCQVFIYFLFFLFHLLLYFTYPIFPPHSFFHLLSFFDDLPMTTIFHIWCLVVLAPCILALPTTLFFYWTHFFLIFGFYLCLWSDNTIRGHELIWATLAVWNLVKILFSSCRVAAFNLKLNQLFLSNNFQRISQSISTLKTQYNPTVFK